jgi:hypothetical protein
MMKQWTLFETREESEMLVGIMQGESGIPVGLCTSFSHPIPAAQHVRHEISQNHSKPHPLHYTRHARSFGARRVQKNPLYME